MINQRHRRGTPDIQLENGFEAQQADSRASDLNFTLCWLFVQKENSRSYNFNVIAREGPTDKVTLSKALEEVWEKVMRIYRKSFQVETAPNTKARGREGFIYLVLRERGRERRRRGEFTLSEMHTSSLYNVMSSDECTNLCNRYQHSYHLGIFGWKT